MGWGFGGVLESSSRYNDWLKDGSSGPQKEIQGLELLVDGTLSREVGAVLADGHWMFRVQ